MPHPNKLGRGGGGGLSKCAIKVGEGLAVVAAQQPSRTLRVPRGSIQLAKQALGPVIAN